MVNGVYPVTILQNMGSLQSLSSCNCTSNAGISSLIYIVACKVKHSRSRRTVAYIRLFVVRTNPTTYSDEIDKYTIDAITQ